MKPLQRLAYVAGLIPELINTFSQQAVLILLQLTPLKKILYGEPIG